MTDLCNIEAEQAVLGALLTNNQAFLYIGNLAAQHFYEPLHQRIFLTMQRNFDAGILSSPVLIKDMFTNDPALMDIGGAACMASLIVAGIAVNHIGDYTKLVIDLAHRRALLQVLDDARPLLTACTGSPAEQAMAVSEKLSVSVSDMQTSLFQDDYEVTEGILQDMKRDAQPYKTGYQKLDDAMDGGLYPGKSYGFAARKKLGKTILAGSIGSNLNMAGVRYLFICGEMSPAEVQKRTLARLLRVHPSMFNHAGVGGKARAMTLIAELARKSPRNMIYKNAPGLTFDDLKRYVLLARMQKKITGFILDYWQLVGGKPKGKSTAEHLDEVAQWIADTCRKYDLWSITMAQINQEGNTRGGEGIRLAFDQVYTMRAPNDDAGRRERWLEMSDTRYTAWRSVGSGNNPGMYLNEMGPYFSETVEDNQEALVL